VDIATIGSVVVMAGVVGARGTRSTAASFLAYGAAFGALASTTVITGAEGAQGLLTTGEAAALAFACLVPFAVGLRVTRGLLIAWGVCAVIAFGGLAGASASSIRILMLWNGGLTGALAPAWYAAAAGALAVCFAGLIRAGRWWECAALALLVAGGFGLHSTHQSALVLGVLATLAMVGTMNSGPLDEVRMPAASEDEQAGSA